MNARGAWRAKPRKDSAAVVPAPSLADRCRPQA